MLDLAFAHGYVSHRADFPGATQVNVLLIQPPDTACRAVPRRYAVPSDPICPPWDLLCLQAYLNRKTTHVASLLDAQFLTDLDEQLPPILSSCPVPDLAVIWTPLMGLGQAMATTGVLRRHCPSARVALCGPFPSLFPEAAAQLDAPDFLIAGDPEPILHHLLDTFQTPSRWERIPGLTRRGAEPGAPRWLSDLNGLVLPEWDRETLLSYASPAHFHKAVLRIRITRGHTGCPADRAFGGAGEPLRTWRLDRLAACVQRASDKGVAEVAVSDPPGIWTPTFLDQWCAALLRVRNGTPWSLRLLPTLLTDDSIDALVASRCARVVFIVPSADPDHLRKYGCVLTRRQFAATLAELQRRKLQPHLEIWLGGPEERRGERHRVVRLLKGLGFPPFVLRPFPDEPDAPLVKEIEAEQFSDISDWVRWACNPWNAPRPRSLWSDDADVARLERDMYYVMREVLAQPVMLGRQISAALRRIVRRWFQEEPVVIHY